LNPAELGMDLRPELLHHAFMTGQRGLVLAVALGLTLTLAGGCGGDGSNSGSSTCHCDFGDSCEEYSSDCAFTECEHNGMNAKGNGSCSLEGVVGVCPCPDDDVTTYYTADYPDPQDDCDFWCGEGVYQAR